MVPVGILEIGPRALVVPVMGMKVTPLLGCSGWHWDL